MTKSKSKSKTKSRTKAKTKSKSRAKHQSRKSGVGGLIAFFVVLVLLIGAYGAAGFYFSQHFLPGTVLNGCDVSMMTIEQAKSALVDSSLDYKLTLVEQDFNKEIINGDEVGLQAKVSDSFDSMLDIQSGMLWAVNILGNNDLTLKEGTVTYSYDNDMLSDVVDELECVDPEYPLEVKNAEIVLVDGKYEISPESVGNVAHRDELVAAIDDAIITQKDSINLEECGVYDMPEIYSDDPDLLAQKALYDEVNDLVITLKIGSKTIPIGVGTTSGWIKTEKQKDGTYKLGVKKEKIEEYVKTLANTYDTFDKAKLFKTHSGNTIEITTGAYGWKLDQEFAVDKLKNYVVNKQSVSIDLTDGSKESDEWWFRRAVAYDAEGTGYYGNSYAEVSINEQHMWLYLDGAVALETDVVTGNPNLGNATPMGAFRIIYHQAPATLRGPGYETQVAYWMVFADDVGFHDATWQPYFGGSLYLVNGSHGCVNMPLDKAGQLYELIYDHMPVFVY